jgi:hypothetical protein
MRGLTLMRRQRRLTPLELRRRERGAAASIVAILLGGGVIMGFAALSIDVGSLMWERRQLQNGADSAALALAQTCATDPSACTTTSGTTQTMLTGLNNVNSYKDSTAGFDPTTYAAPAGGLAGVCGRAIGGLVACNAPTSTLADCAPLPSGVAADPAIPYVEVHTLSKEADGNTLLPKWIAQTIAGGASDSGNRVAACGRAAYGAPGGASSAPITFSMCEWRANTNNGASYYTDPVGAAPGYDGPGQPAWPAAASTPPAAPLVGQEIKIYLQSHGIASSCYNWNGHDVPGGFGYLNAGGCSAVLEEGDWIQVDTGNNAAGCDLAPLVGKVIYLPVFDCTLRSHGNPGVVNPLPSDCDEGTGNLTWYHIAGWAKFYLSGYKTGGSQEQASLVSGVVPCSNGDRCISGWFLEGVLRDRPVAGPPVTNGFGTYAIQPAG